MRVVERGTATACGNPEEVRQGGDARKEIGLLQLVDVDADLAAVVGARRLHQRAEGGNGCGRAEQGGPLVTECERSPTSLTRSELVFSNRRRNIQTL